MIHTCILTFLLLLQTPSASKPAQPPAKAVSTLPGETVEQYWDRAYTNPDLKLPTEPNAFLTRVVKGVKPGRALEIGIGRGRNSIYLAKLGWDVTGFDISARGLEQAGAAASVTGVKMKILKAALEDFDYGVAQWDLMVATYEGIAWLPAAAKGLRPGGLLVVEAYSFHPKAPPGSSFRPNELVKLFMDRNLEVIRYEDVNEEPEWIKLGRVIRIFARKPE